MIQSDKLAFKDMNSTPLFFVDMTAYTRRRKSIENRKKYYPSEQVKQIVRDILKNDDISTEEALEKVLSEKIK